MTSIWSTPEIRVHYSYHKSQSHHTHSVTVAPFHHFFPLPRSLVSPYHGCTYSYNPFHFTFTACRHIHSPLTMYFLCSLSNILHWTITTCLSFNLAIIASTLQPTNTGHHCTHTHTHTHTIASFSSLSHSPTSTPPISQQLALNTFILTSSRVIWSCWHSRLLLNDLHRLSWMTCT